MSTERERERGAAMATRPGPLTEWPWHRMGNFKVPYATLLPPPPTSVLALLVARVVEVFRRRGRLFRPRSLVHLRMSELGSSVKLGRFSSTDTSPEHNKQKMFSVAALALLG